MKKLLLVIVVALVVNISDAAAQTTPAPAPAPAPKDSTTSWFNIADSAIFKGKYKVEGVPFDYVEIVIKEAKLYFYAGDYQGNLEPLKDKKDAFDALGQAIFSFVRNADATDADGLKIDYNGQVIEGKKERK